MNAQTSPSRALAPNVVADYRSAILQKLGLAPETARPAVMCRWMERIERIDALEIHHPDALRRALQVISVQPGAVLYYWGGWDDIREFRREDLLASAPMIWKATAPDDVDIFDDSLDWLLTIEHTGEVGWIDLRPEAGANAG